MTSSNRNPHVAFWIAVILSGLMISLSFSKYRILDHPTEGRASWSRKCLRKLKRSQRTSSPRKRGLRGINTPLLKTSRYSSQFSGVFSRDSYLGVLRALLTGSNNQCCIPLDSTTYLYSRLKIKHILTTWVLSHFIFAILWLSWTWDSNIA